MRVGDVPHPIYTVYEEQSARTLRFFTKYLPVKEVQLKSIQGKRCQRDSKQSSVLTEFMINFVDPKLLNTTKH